MGRIVHQGETLVDADEAAKIMRRCRRTITRLVARGELKKIDVPGSRRAWFRKKDIELLSGFGTSLKSNDEQPHRKFLKRWHPEMFP